MSNQSERESDMHKATQQVAGSGVRPSYWQSWLLVHRAVLSQSKEDNLSCLQDPCYESVILLSSLLCPGLRVLVISWVRPFRLG